MKNIIISALLIYNFSMVPGWTISGFNKFLACFCMVLCLAFLIGETERIIKGGF